MTRKQLIKECLDLWLPGDALLPAGNKAKLEQRLRELQERSKEKSA